jgi:hypothetical protein
MLIRRAVAGMIGWNPGSTEKILAQDFSCAETMKAEFCR